MEFSGSAGRRYGLAFHGSSGENDLIDAARLANIIFPQIKGRLDTTARPLAVTLAACYSANQGSPFGAGPSIAYALHDAGVPLVVASQFPLSVDASLILTKVLYDGLLSGDDPRELLIDVRRRLKVRLPGTYDWASVVAYAAFPQDLDEQLARARVNQAASSIEAAVAHADLATKTLAAVDSNAKGSSVEVLTPANEKLRSAMARMEAVLAAPRADKAVVHGLLARAYKRKADVLWEASKKIGEYYETEALAFLDKSRKHYYECFEIDRSQTWAAVQAMVLTLALEGQAELERRIDSMNLARLLSAQDFDSDNRQRRAWAYGNALELTLLEHCMPGKLVGNLPPWDVSLQGLELRSAPVLMRSDRLDANWPAGMCFAKFEKERRHTAPPRSSRTGTR
jgi:hypothetical protein